MGWKLGRAHGGQVWGLVLELLQPVSSPPPTLLPEVVQKEIQTDSRQEIQM